MNYEKWIKSLTEALVVNDRELVYEGKKAPVKPVRAIGELARSGGKVFPALVGLIERYEQEREGRYYIEYVIEVLGRINEERSATLILRILLASTKAEIDNDDSVITCVRWLGRLGKTAVPQITKFVNENYEDESAVMSAVEALEEVRDRRLVPLLVKLLAYPNPLIVQSALLSLRKQDDKSAVPSIIPLLQYGNASLAEQKQAREYAQRALRFLLRNDRRRLREVMAGSPPQSRLEGRASVRGTDWNSIAWAYVEKRNGEAIIGYVDDSDRTRIFLHMPRIREDQGGWVDYFSHLEKLGISPQRGPDFGCLAVAKNQIRSIKEIEPTTMGTSTHCIVCGNPISTAAFCGDECRGLFYIMYGDEILTRHMSERANNYERARLPSDRTVRAMFEAVTDTRPRLQEAADYFVQDYGTKPTKVSFRPYELLALYDVIDNSIIISSTKTGKWQQLGLWEAINLTLFEHLCECESWKFDNDPRKNIEKQRTETRMFVERVFGKCVRMGLMPPPPTGSFPAE